MFPPFPKEEENSDDVYNVVTEAEGKEGTMLLISPGSYRARCHTPVMSGSRRRIKGKIIREGGDDENNNHDNNDNDGNDNNDDNNNEPNRDSPAAAATVSTLSLFFSDGTDNDDMVSGWGIKVRGVVVANTIVVNDACIPLL